MTREEAEKLAQAILDNYKVLGPGYDDVYIVDFQELAECILKYYAPCSN